MLFRPAWSWLPESLPFNRSDPPKQARGRLIIGSFATYRRAAGALTRSQDENRMTDLPLGSSGGTGKLRRRFSGRVLFAGIAAPTL